ncbi:MAG: hypothetical protein GQ570_08770 [Helicobacteraceae bacterium]|nr:hypothetical protein [Helicobacteraceae bacterium]
MLKFFEKDHRCEVLIDPPFKSEDIKTLSTLFSKNYISWSIIFGRIYSVEVELIQLLYKEIIKNKKSISLTTHKYKLNRYFHQLGFTTTFNSLIKDDVIDVESVEVVLIGGSADSSSKVMEIIKNCSFKNLTLIIVQHVEANGTQLFDKVLQEYTSTKVTYAKDGEEIKKSRIYIAPHNTHLKVIDGYFALSFEKKYNFSRPSISISYDSFSTYYKDKLVVIQECGYSNDGVDKLKLLKKNKTKIIIQDKCECEAKPMVLNALELNLEDYIFNIQNIVSFINFLDLQNSDSHKVEYLLDMILKIYGYDFRLYQRSMIERRLKIFMLKHDIHTIKNAVGVILFNRSAFKGFFLEASINVTELFRDTLSFSSIVDLLKHSCTKKQSLKIWSAGCSSGEEAYSIGIILKSLAILDKSIIYATDFNSVILEEAKNAIYSQESYKVAKNNFNEINLDDNLDNYITQNSNFITINENIRKKVLFFQHNLATDSSFNEFDIIICKNVIIYFDNTLQNRVFQLFYDSLKFGGFLVLGESEAIQEEFTNKFIKCTDKCKIFKKVA